MEEPFGGLYLHIPFCVQRCSYCDFSTSAVPQDSPRIDEYLEKLVSSIDMAGKGGLLRGLRTIYIGGGTPSYLGPKRLEVLLEAVGRNVDLDRIEEFTMEANPDSFSMEMARMAAQLGVDRFSIGVQSLDSMVLGILGRAHKSRTALDALDMALSNSDNVSADLICGVMGDHKAAMLGSLVYVKRFGVQHVSVYPLTIEEGTPLQRKISEGKLLDVDQDEQADEMESVRNSLVGDGYEHYEVSSYALPGFHSKHNLGYWTGVPYLGLGNGAASMFHACDEGEVRDSGALQSWGWVPDAGDARAEAGDAAPATGGERSGGPGECVRVRVATGPSSSYSPQAGAFSEERLDVGQTAAEDLMLAMRTMWGVSEERYREFVAANPALADAEREACGKGLACWQDGSFVPTQRGWLLGNELYGAIWAKSGYSDQPF